MWVQMWFCMCFEALHISIKALCRFYVSNNKCLFDNDQHPTVKQHMPNLSSTVATALSLNIPHLPLPIFYLCFHSMANTHIQIVAQISLCVF